MRQRARGNSTCGWARWMIGTKSSRRPRRGGARRRGERFSCAAECPGWRRRRRTRRRRSELEALNFEATITSCSPPEEAVADPFFFAAIVASCTRGSSSRIHFALWRVASRPLSSCIQIFFLREGSERRAMPRAKKVIISAKAGCIKGLVIFVSSLGSSEWKQFSARLLEL